ncbi:protein of unknown function [Candidatus Nitrosocosmicus franklandus]|uniref:Uncharacterized protein n=1 Tax=Candidatus Nitrosocosmicus franklandianus TaxID=1798806 RepID=A0A484I7A1_9ARCH|nr:protein of unknown function [Candidatus Nitrosocosmicus franklandus]
MLYFLIGNLHRDTNRVLIPIPYINKVKLLLTNGIMIVQSNLNFTLYCD